MLYRVIYVSASKSLPGAAGIAGLLRAARHNNVQAGITGILLYHDGGFLQVLEGMRAPVERVFAAICADPRHHQVITLWRGPVEGRLFGDWRMGFVPPEGWPVATGEDEVVDLRRLLLSDAPWFHDRITGPLLRRFMRSYRDLPT